MDSWVLCPCQRSRLDLLKRLLASLEHPEDRVVIVATLPDPICPWEIDGADHVIQSSSPNSIAKWWNTGLDYIRGIASKRYEILTVSSDNIGTPYSVALLGVFLRQNNLTMAGPNYQTRQVKFFNPATPPHPWDRVPGGCWMLAGESGLRVDENFRWWYADDDLDMQARSHRGSGTIPDTGFVAEPDTPLSEEKQRWAVEDRQRFVDKWGKQPW